ncbi:MAG: hypothetical protein HOB40_06245 [Candidatus Marinimicrobia bacterium]|jgi:hypothetical protein|nr:hypothetical protein [Candidatus Neomarinimicrobiota bacterium]MBT3501455.1 hypothetical protein [Candidatus Neomarinimicrobiota bacterium]MBT3839406.1 hypothetical protein [Candidatus Neomarinimicrobiota bacterium]MBT3998879.1 hypothetical protein [Candidatus Neomarinimicrobiota bacterium]MBT4283081.1 hypothetical protein [Candidatus Neomarinimicrobiota bacterium]
MKKTLINRLVFFFGFFTLLWGQVTLSIAEYRPFPDKIALLNIQPTKVGWSIANKFLLLDANQRELIELGLFGDVTLASGISSNSRSFGELSWLGVSPKGIEVVDRLENEVSILDYRLNHVLSTELEPRIFPEKCAIDSWGRLFLFSRTYNAIFVLEHKQLNKKPFIDLTREFSQSVCVLDLEVDQDGNLLLLDCSGMVHVFNRLGKIQFHYPSKIDNAEFLVPVRNRLFVFNTLGEGISINTDERVSIPGASVPVLDMVSMNRSIAVLAKDHILVLDVK